MKINFKGAFNTVMKFGEQHKSEFATGAGLVLMIAGTVGAVVATVKTMRAVADVKAEKLDAIIEEAGSYEDMTAEEQQEYDEIADNPLSFKEAAEVSWKYWIAPGACIVLGTTSIIYSDKVQGHRIGLLTTALASQIAEAKDYKEAAKEIFGDKEEEIEREQERRRAQNYDDGPKSVIDTGTGNQLFKDYYSPNLWIKASPAYIEACRNELNDLINTRRERSGLNDEWVTLSDWYDILSLEIEHTSFSDTFGFNVRDGMVEFSASYADTGLTKEGYSYRLIRFRNGPDYLPFV